MLTAGSVVEGARVGRRLDNSVIGEVIVAKKCVALRGEEGILLESVR